MKKETLVSAFPTLLKKSLCILRNFKNTFFHRTPLVAASVRLKISEKFVIGYINMSSLSFSLKWFEMKSVC